MRSTSLRCGIIAVVLSTTWQATAADPPLIPPNNDDIRAFGTALNNAKRFDNEYCIQQALKPTVDGVRNYLSDMKSWLDLAKKDSLANLKSLQAEQIATSDRARQIEMIVAMQEALLQSSELLLDLSSLKELTDGILEWADPKPNPSPAAKSAKKENTSIFSKLKALGAAAGTVKDAGQHFTTTLRTEPLDESLLPVNQRQLVQRINKEIPADIQSLSDIIDVATKIKGYADTAKDLTNFADLKKLILTWGTLVARYRQSKLMDELKELRDNIDALNLPVAANTSDYRRLAVRAELVAEILDALNKLPFSATPCDRPCPTVARAQAVPNPGGEPFQGSTKTYGEALRKFDAATTLKAAAALAGAIDRANQSVADQRKDREKATLTGRAGDQSNWPGPTYDLGETISFTFHRGSACHGPDVNFITSGLSNGGSENIHLGQMTADQSGTFTPKRGGKWTGLLVGNNTELGPRFTVRADQSDIAGVWTAQGGWNGAGQRPTDERIKINHGLDDHHVTAVKLTGDIYVPEGSVTFRGSYVTSPFAIQMQCAAAGHTNITWVPGTITVLDKDHLRLNGGCSGADGMTFERQSY